MIEAGKQFYSPRQAEASWDGSLCSETYYEILDMNGMLCDRSGNLFSAIMYAKVYDVPVQIVKVTRKAVKLIDGGLVKEV